MTGYPCDKTVKKNLIILLHFELCIIQLCIHYFSFIIIYIQRVGVFVWYVDINTNGMLIRFPYWGVLNHA